MREDRVLACLIHKERFIHIAEALMANALPPSTPWFLDEFRPQFCPTVG